MLISIIPLFDSQMTVTAYSFFTQKGNSLMTGMQNTGSFDGASNSLALEVIQNMGLESLTEGKPVFVPITNIALFADIDRQCDAPPDKITFLLDRTVEPKEIYIKRILALKELGFHFAIRKVKDYEAYAEIIRVMDYIFLDHKKSDVKVLKQYFNKHYHGLKVVACNIEYTEDFKSLQYRDFDLYEGKFYRLPLTKRGNNAVTPLKVNYIQLLNIVNDENFEITKVADVVQQDISLAISLLKLVNSLGLASEIKTIRHAAAILGQRELRKWINTAVTSELYSDKPNEITKLSLIRAKFAENLAPVFEMAISSQELFLLGLFSVLDIILEMPMKDALEIVKIGGNIKTALVEQKGKYAPVLDFIRNYESADWQEVSRLIIIYNISVKDVYKAYMGSLEWYSKLLGSIGDNTEAETTSN